MSDACIIIKIMAKNRLTKSQRRKWRKEAKIRKKKLEEKKKNIRFDKKLQKPWEAVKMKMFSFPNPFEGISMEERRKMFREVGEKAEKEFNEKFLKLGHWFEEYDSLYLLSFCSHYFLSHQEGVDPEATGALEFYPHYQEWLQAFALTKKRKIDGKPLQGDADKLFEEMKEIGSVVSMRLVTKMPESESKNEELMEKYRLRLEMQGNTTAVRNWAYMHQMKRVSIETATLINDDFKNFYGVKSSVVIELLFKLIDIKTDEMNDRMQSIRKCVRQKTFKDMITEYRKIFPDVKEMDDMETEGMWKLSGNNRKNLGMMLLMHSDLFLQEIYSFDVDFLLRLLPDEKIDRNKLKKIFDLLSLKFGELSNWDPEHFILGNPISKRPFINLENGKYFMGVMGLMPDKALDILESLIWNNKELKDKYTDLKAMYLEDKVYEMIKSNFPNGQVFRGSMYGENHENDITLVIDTFAVVLEAKSGKVSDPAKRGAPDDLFETLQRLIEKPSEQALRFIDYLSSNKKAHAFKNKFGGVNEIDSTKINYFIPLGVTFSNLGMVSGNLKKLLRAKVVEKKLEDLAPSISFTDLEIVLELLESEPQRLHYLSRRREFEAHIEYEGDEMDILAFYLNNGFNIGESEYQKDCEYHLALWSKELDPYVVGTSEGRIIEKPRIKQTQWWKDILEFASRKKTTGWVESCYIMHNFPYDDQLRFEKELKKLKQQIINGDIEKPHNWGVFVSGAERRRFAVAVYPYTTEDVGLRNSIMDHIFTDTEKQYALRGMIVIGQNLNARNYPYSVIARKTATDLFDTLTL